MGRKQTLPKYQVYTSADTTTNPESIVTDVHMVDEIDYDIEVDATVDGTLEVQYDNEQWDKDADFRPLNFNTPLTINGATDTQYRIEIKQSFKKAKLVFTNNGGTGNISAWITGTTVGA